MNTITMQDVADRAGVSNKTVSRVINNEPRVSPATREKIQKIIDEMNFQPNKSVRVSWLLNEKGGASWLIS